jgi:hypothetical protein
MCAICYQGKSGRQRDNVSGYVVRHCNDCGSDGVDDLVNGRCSICRSSPVCSSVYDNRYSTAPAFDRPYMILGEGVEAVPGDHGWIRVWNEIFDLSTSTRFSVWLGHKVCRMIKNTAVTSWLGHCVIWSGLEDFGERSAVDGLRALGAIIYCWAWAFAALCAVAYVVMRVLL